jgi:outer membrane biosynthesis protein TonB
MVTVWTSPVWRRESMFCSNCGQPLTEGKAFCKNCGAPVTQPAENVAAADTAALAAAAAAPEDQPTAVRPPEDQPTVVTPPEEQPTVVRPPEDQPTVQMTPAPPPPPPPTFVPPPPPPPQVMAGHGQGWQPPQGPPPRRSSTGLIVGIIAAAVVVLAGIGVGTWLVVRDDGTTDTTTVMQTTTTSEALATTTTMVETTTSSMVTDSTTETTAGGYTEQDYLIAVGEMITRLTEYDTRMPQLADEINANAPDVPQWVYDELNGMMLELEEAYDRLGYMPMAPGFEDADYWLDEAILFMDDRIWYTLQGIEAMWDGADAGDYFDQGREARDDYREAMTKFWEVVPAG